MGRPPMLTRRQPSEAMLAPASPPTQPLLPESQTTAPQSQNPPAKANEVVDAELDSLRKQLDQM